MPSVVRKTDDKNRLRSDKESGRTVSEHACLVFWQWYFPVDHQNQAGSSHIPAGLSDNSASLRYIFHRS